MIKANALDVVATLAGVYYGFGHVLRVGVGFACAGAEMHVHDDRRIRFRPMCGRGLGVRR